MAEVSIRGLVKEFGDFTAVDGIDLDIADGEFVTLLGPSGCGKTTTLRCLAGLEEPTGGEITIGGTAVAAPERGVFVPPERRNTGMVFQSYALWPHLTVRSNIAYPLKLGKRPKAEINQRVGELLTSVGLLDKADHLVPSLSGGQQQRVALARAMANDPQLLLFDEPLSNLDAKLRTGMRSEIRRLHAKIGTTSVYVTHDQEEAMVLSDRVVVMHEGRIQQVGSPRELYTRPCNRFVADFMGFENILDATVVAAASPGFYTVTATGGGPELLVAGTAPAQPGGAVVVAFRSAHLRIGHDQGKDATVVTGRVVEAVYLGSRTELDIDCGGLPLRAYVDDADLVRLAGEVPRAGDEVTVTLPAAHVVTLGGETVAVSEPLTHA